MRREQDNLRKIQKATDGPAHKLVSLSLLIIVFVADRVLLSQVDIIVKNKSKKEEDFYQSLMDKDDSLNKQLLLSEERGELRKKGPSFLHLDFVIITTVNNSIGSEWKSLDGRVRHHYGFEAEAEARGR